SSCVPSATTDVDFFGKLESAKRQEDILPALQIVEPRLQRLSLIPFAGQLVIHGDIGHSRLMPIPFMGEGLRRLLSLVLAMANTPGGIVLIDEVENGLHYSVLEKVWQAVAGAAQQFGVQLFATTHSWECIRSAHEALAASEVDDLRLHRLDRFNGEITAVTYDRAMRETALRAGLEMR